MTDQDPHVPQRRSLRDSAADEPHTDPERRSLVPPSQELPVQGQGAEGEYDAGDGSEWPTEVMPAPQETDDVHTREPDAAAPLSDDPAESSTHRAWFKAPWFIGVAAGAGVVLLGGGIAWAVMAAGGSEAVAASETPSPSPSASPVPSPEPGIVTLLDDGIADEEYPPLAPSLGEGYPEAYEMQDWVWDKVGPGWALVSLGVGKQAFDESFTGDVVSPDGVYLASPEGALFSLVSMPLSDAELRVVSWLEDSRSARLYRADASESGDGGGGQLVDFATGELFDMSFTVADHASQSEGFIAASENNVELWSAYASYDTQTWTQKAELEWWSEDTGWGEVPLSAGVTPWGFYASPTGEWAFSEYYSQVDSKLASENSGPPGEPTLLAVHLTDMTTRVIRPDYSALVDPWCTLSGVTQEGTPLVVCYLADQEDVYEVPADGAVRLYAGGEAPTWTAATVTSPDGSITATSALEDGSIYDLRVTVDGDEVVVARSGEGLPVNGLRAPVFRDAGDGLVLVTGVNGCTLVDTRYGYAVPLLVAANTDVVGCVGYGIGSE